MCVCVLAVNSGAVTRLQQEEGKREGGREYRKRERQDGRSREAQRVREKQKERERERERERESERVRETERERYSAIVFFFSWFMLNN